MAAVDGPTTKVCGVRRRRISSWPPLHDGRRQTEQPAFLLSEDSAPIVRGYAGDGLQPLFCNTGLSGHRHAQSFNESPRYWLREGKLTPQSSAITFRGRVLCRKNEVGNHCRILR